MEKFAKKNKDKYSKIMLLFDDFELDETQRVLTSYISTFEANLIEDCEKELTKRGSKVWIEGTLVNKRHERKNLLINAA